MAKTAVLLLFCLLSGAAGQSLNCNFENKFCNYKQDTSDTFDWVWNTKGNGGINNGPATDHTLLSPQPIKTIAGNANGANCVFPFTYNKKTYTNCININHPYKWCSTTSNYDKDKKWGNCIPKGKK
ncbi:72 kDa type IV collagenase [Exaiptasia diaphana]|uniref:Uncharacterized protein n=1 Tax=Exaiptasia diaphana TaxID=2652724 RepID=A0A913XHJ1_EXADI|nr:72 kDa type IV collagenase [Exaiptasia diaphana]XP_020904505.1 72 kDa type IV collagenase [Exaiptasia diaphana]